MLLNYFLLAFRNIIKQRGFAVINMLGLALGLAASLFILLYVRDELTYDTMHPEASNTYRMGYVINFPNGEKEAAPYAPAGWDNYLQANYSGVGAITSYDTYGMPTSLYNEQNDRTSMTEDMVWAEPSFPKVIYLPIIKGDRNNPLKEINSIVLSESTAKELFGDEDPINKTLVISHIYATNGKKIEMMVTAVSKDLPSNSHVNPKYVANVFALKPFIKDLETRLNTSMGDAPGNNYFSQSYFTLDDAGKLPMIQNDLQKKANEILAKNKWDFKFTPVIRKITDIHFDKEMDWTIDHKTSDIKSVYVFITIAILILMVACINYINLSTAKSASRAREIGLRKTFGGVRTQLFFQFMLESFILVLISALIALLLVILLTPQFNILTGKTFTLQHIFNGQMLLIILGVIAFVTILAGSYPALFVSGFEPATVLKGKFAFGKGSNVFRQFLTTVQFVVAVTLLVGTVILVRQMSLMRDSKLNEAGKQIISIRYGGFTGPATDRKYLAFKNAVESDPEITDMTLANHLPRLDFFGSINMEMQFPEISEEKHKWFQLNGDYFFPKTFGLTVIAGRDFDPKNIADSTSVLINMSAVNALHLTPQEVIGKSIIRPGLVQGYSRNDTTILPVTGTVIGVVEDFPYRSMHKKIEPLAIAPKPHSDDRIIHIRLPQGKISEKILSIEKTWKEVYPNFGFDYWFIDEEFGRMYESETRVAALTEKFSWLAILITCVGLYGLASFMSQQRIKEIGIRKTMGASNSQVLVLLLSVFGKLLLIACVIALPVAYYLTNQWLQGFEYRTPLSVVVFAGAIGLIAVITLLTVGYESLKASMSNPIKALRHE